MARPKDPDKLTFYDLGLRPDGAHLMDTDGDDHLHDCLRYALMTRPQPREGSRDPRPLRRSSTNISEGDAANA